MPEPVSVLFVCLGNICRSTMAEGIFQHLSKQKDYQGLISNIDSCGTGGYHQGDDPDDRTMATLHEHGIKDYQHAARQIRVSDFDEFDYIFAMDTSNLQNVQSLQRRKPDSSSQVMLFGDWSGKGRGEVVKDPWYGGQAGFDKAYEQCSRFSKNFLDKLSQDSKSNGGEE